MSESLPKNPEHSKPPWVLLLSIGAVILLALILLWHQYRQDRATRELTQKLDAIKAQGYPTSPGELDAWYTEPPTGQNAATIYGQAFSQMTPQSQTLPWYYSGTSSNIFNRTNPITPAAQAELASLVVSNQSALQLLHDGGKLPGTRYPVNLSAGHNTLLPHLSQLREATRLLSAEALGHALSDQSEAAIDSLVAAMRLGHSLSHEPVFISYLVQVANYTLTVNALENILNRRSIPEMYLIDLDAELIKAENSLHLTRALAGERSISIGHFDNPFSLANGGGSVSTSEAFAASAYKLSGLQHSDFSTYLEFMDKGLAASQLPLAERVPAFNQIDQDLENRISQGRWRMLFTSMMIPALSKSGEKSVAVVAHLRLARLAIMLLSYQAEHDGKLPAKLDELTVVPLDPFDDKPLRYRQTETGFLIWSIGPDEIDQNGQPRSRNSSEQAYDLLFTIERLKTDTNK